MGALAAHRQPLAVTQAAIAGQIHKALDVHGDLATQIAFAVFSTLAFALVFAARFIVQHWLYDEGSTGWLAVARIAMGYPLLGLGLLVVYWAVRVAKRRGADEANERMLEVPTDRASRR